MRIGIVNDVPMAIEAMRRVLLRSGGHEIAWTAEEGEQAVERCLRDRPDLVLMDLVMPQIDGVEATRRIMGRCPCAIVVVTANVNDNCSLVFQAMSAGALDAVNTPVLEWPGSSKGGAELLAKVETIRKLLGLKPSSPGPPPRQPRPSPPGPPADQLVAIGASAGGPAALARIISYLPASFASPIVIVQHVDAQFAPALASWLDAQTPLRVLVAQEGDCPAPGTVLLAGRDQHLVFADERRLAYTPQPLDCSYHPSVDVFFQSARNHWPGTVVGLLLTGMGRDGAQGLRDLRRDGHCTIAQDQTSSAVYGMPKAAAELDAASEILNLDQIGLRLRMLGTKPVGEHA